MILGPEETATVEESLEYVQLCAELHEKYKAELATIGDYPNEYWDEFNDRFDKIAEKVLRREG